jgi:bacterioferritin
MRGNEKVINELNRALSAELTAIVQYMVQAEMCDNWGYRKLGGATKKRAIEEMRHAEGLIERILFLDGIPAVEVAIEPKIGASVEAQLELDLRDEVDAVKQYNAAVAMCRQEADNGTRELFEKMIRDEEMHTDYLEAQLRVISEVGIQNYLSEQMQGG